MKTHHLALLSALVPFAALVSGCGGGGNSAGPTSPTPSPTFIGSSTGTPNFPTIAVPETLLLLPGGELGFLNLKRTGGSAEGDLRVPSGISSSSSLAPGVYPLSGVISNATVFSASNQGVGDAKFTLAGNLAAVNGGGNITFARGKFSTPARILIDGGRLPASTPYRESADLTFSNIRSLNPIAIGPLRAVAMHITDDFVHVRVIVVGGIGFVFVQNFDDALARLVTDRFFGFVVAVVAFPAHLFRVVGLQILFQFAGRHVDGLAELFKGLLLFVGIGHRRNAEANDVPEARF